MEICIECNKRPVSIKKRKLCSTCYSALRKAGEDFTPDGNSRQTRTKYANVRAETFCLDCGFDYGSSNCQGCEYYSCR